MPELDMHRFNKVPWYEGRSQLSKYEQRDWWLRIRQSMHNYFFTQEGPASLIETNKSDPNCQPGEVIRVCIRERLLIEAFGLTNYYYDYLQKEGPLSFIRPKLLQTQD